MTEIVDLIVTGVADNLSAAELSDRLVTEFGQPAEAFSDLVNGACNQGACYAAQSEVSTEVAEEGRAKLEQMGLICEIRAFASGQVIASTLVNNIADQPDEAESAEDDVETLDLSFADEIDELAASGSVRNKSNEIPAPEQPVAAPAEEEEPEADEEISDELASDDTGSDKISELTAVPVVNQGPESQHTDLTSDADNFVDATDELEVSFDDESASADVLEQTSGLVASDDAGLSLSEDDHTALSSKASAHAVKGVVNLTGRSSGDEGSLELTLDAAPDASSNAQHPEPVSIEPVVVLQDIQLDVAMEEVTGSEAGDLATSDLETAQALDSLKSTTGTADSTITGETDPDSATAEPLSDDENPESAGEVAPVEVAVTALKADSPADDTVSDAPPVAAESGVAENIEAAAPAGAQPTSALSSIIAEIETAAADGLVLPAQTANVAPVENEQSSMDQQVEILRRSREEVAVLRQKIGEDIELETEAFSQFRLNGMRKEVRRLAAVAGVVVIVGGGGLVVQQSGLFGKEDAAIPVAAIIVEPVSNDVEEVSLNAAIERTAALPNPEKFSTQELLVYLTKGLGLESVRDLEGLMSGTRRAEDRDSEPRIGAAIAADIRSKLWLKNRVAHPADQYFDEWSKREHDLRVFLELQERLLESGDLNVASELGKRTKDKFFSVMSAQRLARAYGEAGKMETAIAIMQTAAHDTYAIPVASERVLAIADHALSEQELGLGEEALDSFLKVSILARNLNKPENRTVGLSAVAAYFLKAGHEADARQNLVDALDSANQLPEYTAARDLAIRHVALTEVAMGFTTVAMEHAHLIMDPFAAVSAYHGIALALEKRGEDTNARRTINMAFRAGSLIEDSEKRTKLLEQVKLAGD